MTDPTTPGPTTPDPAGPDSPHAIIDLAVAFWKSKVLLSAVELKVFAALAEHPSTGQELSARLGITGRGGADFLDALVSMGLLERRDGVYHNSPLADRHLDPAKPATDISGYLEFLNAGFPCWAGLTEGLRTGGRLDFTRALAASGNSEGSGEAAPTEPALVEADADSDTFGEAFAAPDQVTGFLRAMTGYSMGANHALAETHDWRNVRTVVDVGCAEGSLLAQILTRHEHVEGIGFDLPVVEEGFTAHTKQLGIADRVRFEGGDFFTGPLPTADVLVMGHVLHDWDLGIKKMLIRKAYEALPEGGSLLIYESLIDDDRRDRTTGLLISLNVSLVSAGGLGYTGADCRSWLEEAGFTATSVRHLDGPEYLVVGTKTAT
ncbi:Multifunctional cyclase-dehydratase-3-O-methyl transferase TcmN [Streptomyces sp. YIM 121038]|uniref:methyltransferase n=1 Tax=Streptomyces sp. YIM 121038 TaxID=2136401 RepID=UPI001110672E|nr:methyltransferase [Streptomyces sp. YIM 121038]QCX73872.1 Multifunctional cyclase-dehydratase-3-O-methyl transferase TcmN [Streptomyces sp. YIM 121038]